MAKGWQKFETIEVKFEDGKVVVDRENVTLKFNKTDSADSIRWVIWNFPEKMDRLEIRWVTGSPFLNFGVVPSDKLEKKYRDAKVALLGTGNLGEERTFKYDILFCSESHLIGIDPRIVNDGDPV